MRNPYLTSSPDLLHWSVPWKPFPLDEGDDYGSTMQAHFMNCFPYGNQHAGIYSSVSNAGGMVSGLPALKPRRDRVGASAARGAVAGPR